jgi:peptide/nickel transport system substrate-binding protein
LFNTLLACIQSVTRLASDKTSRQRQFSFGKRWLAIILAISFCGSLLFSCGTGSPSNPATNNNRVVIGTTAKVRSFDPADANESFAGIILNNIGERLYTYKPGTTELVPQLATALPSLSADGLTYTISLRQDVLFHDGTPFNAKAMAFSLQRFITNGGRPSSLLTGRVAKVKATGPYEIQIRLQKPFAAFPSVLAFSGLCAVSPQAYSIGEGKFLPKQFVGTGPYRLVRSRTDSLRLEPFERYWGNKPRNPGIDIQVFSSGANLYNALRSGAVDIASQSLQPNQIQALTTQAKTQGWQVTVGASKTVNVLALNLRQPPWDKREARQALASLFNRRILQERVFQGQADPLFSLIPSIFPESQPVFQRLYQDGDPQTGRAFLSQAGYSASNPLTIDLWYRSNLSSDVLAAITLKAVMERDWSDSVKVNLNGIESTTAYGNLDKGVYPMFIFDWTADFLDPDNYIEPFLACSKGSAKQGCEEGSSALSGSFFYSEQVNQLIDQERQETNPQKRQQIFGQLQQILGEEVPFVPLWQTKSFLFSRANIDGVRLEPTQQFPFSSLHKS